MVEVVPVEDLLDISGAPIPGRVPGVVLRRRPDLLTGEAADPDAYEVYNEAHGGFVPCQRGDVVRVDVPGDVYPIQREYLEGGFDRVPDEAPE